MEGFALMYVKDGIVYPVALSKEQVISLSIMLNALPQPITVIFDAPQGQAIDILDNRLKQ